MSTADTIATPSAPLQDTSRRVPRALLGLSLPPGYWTVWGFLDEFEPSVLGLMEEPVLGLVRDDVDARRLAMQMGEPAITMPAPEVLRGSKARFIGRYTRPVLERLYPV